ncbi:hypothetical protein E2C01_073371 [Portunus trituberculatus]|uniref:Uncharacterized protein n=1 Tax=Portunus trituberculatus TaxID=210409 RepID=A0A5B7IAD8_PORTR|nr:hypothetical protein [Portunus trituberculatus]
MLPRRLHLSKTYSPTHPRGAGVQPLKDQVSRDKDEYRRHVPSPVRTCAPLPPFSLRISLTCCCLRSTAPLCLQLHE